MPDYSVYLVTDATPAIVGDRSVEAVVAAALKSRNAEGGGASVGIVQLRDKNADARGLLATLAALHAHTAAAGVPLLLNDRVDVAVVAQARGICEGVHLGQDDIDAATARRLLGPTALIGVTAGTPAEAVAACRAGADYLGLGTVFATATKTDTKHVVGTAGLQHMLAAMARAGYGAVPTVCIGGIGVANARRVLFQSQWAGTAALPSKPIDGIAIVSAIMSAPDPAAAAAALAGQVRLGRLGPTAFYRPPLPQTTPVSQATLAPVLAALRTGALSHNMTNLVVQNFAANVALAIGASPIMSSSGAEAADLARLPGSTLVINMGTATPEGLANYVAAIRAYNAAGRPILFDPVGAGATDVRRAAVRTILAAGYLDVIKGNEGEIQTVWAAGADDDGHDEPVAQQRGVDGSNALTPAAKAALVRRLAARERCVVVLTGIVDYVADAAGQRCVAVAHGHPYLARVTGTGCTLGTTISSTVSAAAAAAAAAAVPAGDTFIAVVAALVLFERAAELAAAQPSVHGPGTFVPAFLDELARCRQLSVDGDLSWIDDLKVSSVNVE